MLQQIQAGTPEVDHPAALWKVYDGGFMMVMLGHMAPGGGIQGGICAVIALPGQADPEASLRTLLGVGDPVHQQAINLYVYEQQADGQRRPVHATETQRIRGLVAEGRLRMAAAATKQEFGQAAAMMMLIVPRLN
jgi:hypothetical protein